MATEIEKLRAQIELGREIDVILEFAMRAQASLSEIMPRMLDTLHQATGSAAVVCRSRDEEGDAQQWFFPNDLPFHEFDLDGAAREVEDANELVAQMDAHTFVGQRLDVSDEVVGTLFIATTDDDIEQTQALAETWAEQVDNYLGAINDARRRQRALSEVSDALKAPILEEGLDHALNVLSNYVHWDELVLVFMSEDYLDRRSLTYRVFSGGEWAYSSSDEMDERVESLLRDAANSILNYATEEETFRALRVTAQHIEDIAIFGQDSNSVIGRLIVGTHNGPLTPFGRTTIDRFADYLRQRAVDFSKEWKRLSRNFPQQYVKRLLQEPNYVQNFLVPTHQHVAILYTDIAGFTHLSEQVLQEPERIGALVDRWSRHVVEIVWETGGVFDKMVGDCIIGLWGPPFFEMTGRQACHAAADAARRIVEYTERLGDSEDFPELKQLAAPLTVATGVNYAPLFVGFFGPSEDYTGFSSGMNNTARLQGVASAGEVLCMDRFVEAYGDMAEFGPKAEALVKNVKDPLRFRPLKLS